MTTSCLVLANSIFPSPGDPGEKFLGWLRGHLPDGVGEGARLGEAKKAKVIVIDDEPLIAETMVEILNHEGFEAVSASDGASAIELAKTLLPDIVLSDVVMPVRNGVETGIRIREALPSCRIILFSGQAATVDLLEKARQRGHSFDVLAKPMKPEQLISVIRGDVN
ncbi:MAG: response regulator [Candidatus Acidiferrum sp.]